MKPIPLIRLSIIMPTIKFLEGIGTPVQRYLNQAHIPIAAIETAETLISLPMAMTFMGAAAAGEGIENIGIAMGQAAKIADVGLLGQLVCQSFTLYDALQQLCHLSQIALSKSGDQLWLIEEADRVWFCQRFPSYRPSEPCLDHSVYYSLALQLDTVRLAMGRHWHPPEVHLPTRPYRGLETKLGLGNTRLQYHKPFTAICIPRRYLGTPVRPQVSRQTLTDQHKREAWEQTSPALDFVGSLEQTLTTLLQNGYPKIERTAEATDMSVRTLQRTLAKHHLTYSRVIDKVRYEAAIPLLKEPHVRLIEVAYALGFQDSSNFSHAFKRWTGQSPRQFRQAESLKA
jgi:AraC-like DNA-binding protein